MLELQWRQSDHHHAGILTDAFYVPVTAKANENEASFNLMAYSEYHPVPAHK